MTTARNAELAPNTTDADGTDVRLGKLLSHIQTRHQQIQKAPATLDIEIDGNVVSCMEASLGSYACELPQWSRSLSLRDDQGAMRAHILLQEQSFSQAPFDHGRLLVSTSRNEDGTLQLLVERASHHELSDDT